MANSNPELIAREIAPNGFKVAWDGLLQFKNSNKLTRPLHRFLDLGCGAGQVMFMALVIADVVPCGIEIQQSLCDVAVKWHSRAATEFHALHDTFTAQSERILCLDMSSKRALDVMLTTDVIFCNNLLFSHPAKHPEKNLNGKLVRQFSLLAAALPTGAYVYVISSSTMSLELETVIPLPREAVSWTIDGHVKMYIGLVRSSQI